MVFRRKREDTKAKVTFVYQRKLQRFVAVSQSVLYFLRFIFLCLFIVHSFFVPFVLTFFCWWFFCDFGPTFSNNLFLDFTVLISTLLRRDREKGDNVALLVVFHFHFVVLLFFSIVALYCALLSLSFSFLSSLRPSGIRFVIS